MRTAKVAIFLVGIGVASAGQVNASQPISVSMAECAAIAFVSAELVETPSRKTYILGVADTWLQAAHSEAGQDMTNIADQKAEHWRKKGLRLPFTQDYRDWSKYCGSLARHRKIKFPKRG